jgi:MFS superfamily sulfate permease-like transporter
MDGALSWNGDWAWSLPLIALSVIFHVIGLGFFNAKLLDTVRPAESQRHLLLSFGVVMGITTLMATLLHAIEATIWAGAYRLLGALPDTKSAMLYSLEAMTSYGHVDLHLAPHWQLMGALEALNGMILLGLTTAFLYGTIQRVWPIEQRSFRRRRNPAHQSASESGRNA